MKNLLKRRYKFKHFFKPRNKFLKSYPLYQEINCFFIYKYNLYIWGGKVNYKYSNYQNFAYELMNVQFFRKYWRKLNKIWRNFMKMLRLKETTIRRILRILNYS